MQGKVISNSGELSHWKRAVCVKRKISLAEVFFATGILLLPYDAFPIMPSTYRPISLVPFFISLLFIISDDGIRQIKLIGRRQLLILGFFALTFCGNAFRVLAGNIQPENYIDTIVTLVIGLLAYFCFTSYLRWRATQESFATTLDRLLHLLSVAYILPLFVGCLEAASLNGLLPSSVNVALISFFGGNQSYRLTLTSFEASWASIHLIIAALCNLFLYRKDKSAFHFVCFCVATVLFFLTNSMQGVMVLGCATAAFILWYGYKKKRLLVIFRWMLIVVGVFVTFLFVLRLYFESSGAETYFATRLVNFTDLTRLIHIDGSSFVRLIFPLIGLQMFMMHPVFGTGAGTFAQQLPKYISEYYPWSVQFEEISRYLNGTLTPSAVCLYTRALGELGLLGSALFFAFVCSSFRCIGNVASRGGLQGLHVVYLIFVLICTPLQFASYAYLPFWLALALLDFAGYKEITNKNIKEMFI